MNFNLFGHVFFVGFALFLLLVKDQVHGVKILWVKFFNNGVGKDVVFYGSVPDDYKDLSTTSITIYGDQYWIEECKEVETTSDSDIETLPNTTDSKDSSKYYWRLREDSTLLDKLLESLTSTDRKESSNVISFFVNFQTVWPKDGFKPTNTTDITKNTWLEILVSSDYRTEATEYTLKIVEMNLEMIKSL